MIYNYGGNKVALYSTIGKEKIVFSESPYYFAIIPVNSRTLLELPIFASCTIYIFRLDSSSKLIERINSWELQKGDAIQIENCEANLELKEGNAVLLVAGVHVGSLSPNITLKRVSDIKKVVKPWGHELWINDQHPYYALKQICIRAPHKTSLQYHNFKQETNVLVDGVANLHYLNREILPGDRADSSAVEKVEIKAPLSIDVLPPTVHRLEALTDLILYESSTPHLDDVIRISDDTFRLDGRINAEHTI